MHTQNATQSLFFASLLFLFFLAACGQGEKPSNGAASVGLSLKFAAEDSQKGSSEPRLKPPGEYVLSVKIQVTTNTGSPAADTVVANVTPGETLIVEIKNVQTGPARTFTVEAFSGPNGTGNLVFQGQKTVDLLPGTSVALTIDMRPAEGPSPGESIALTPKEVTVELLSATTFTADTPDPVLEWSVNDVIGGNEALGTLVIQGNIATYTAPAAFPETNVLTIKALSVTDPTSFGTAKVNLKNPEFQISPRSAIVPKIQKQAFTLSGIAPSNVTWQVNEVIDGNSTLGTIDQNGLYTAPALIPIDTKQTTIGVPLPIRVEAHSKTNPASIDMATLRVMTGSQIGFGENMPLSNAGVSTRSAGQRSIAFYKGIVYATWSDGTNIFFAQSTDGLNWSDPELIFACTGGNAKNPAMAIGSKGEIYIILEETIQGQGTSVWLLIRASATAEFQAEQIVKDSSPSPEPSIAVAPNGTVFMAWATEQELTGYDIFFQRLNFDGTPLDESPRPLTQKSLSEKSPVLNVSESGLVFAAWIEQTFDSSQTTAAFVQSTNSLFAASSTDGGVSFSASVQIDDLSTLNPANAMRPSLAAGPAGTVYVAWERDTCGDGCVEIAFDTGKMGASGLSFGSDQSVRRADQESFPRQYSPSVAWDAANGIYVGFLEEGSDDLIYLAKSTDEGTKFSFSRISDIAGFPKSNPAIAVDRAGRVFSIWAGPGESESGNVAWFSWGE